MKYKLLVVDIDGTIIGKGGQVSAEDREALAKVRQKGIGVSLSTGRAAPSCRPIIERLGLDGYHIFCDGALVSSFNEEIYARPIDRGVVRKGIEFAHQHDVYLELYSVSRFFVERENWATKIHREFFNLEPTVVDFSGLWERERIIKWGLVTASPEEAVKVESFRRHFERSLHFSPARSPAYPHVEFFNVVDLGVSKGKELAALTSHLGIALSEVMAIGDGTNDIPLLSSAGLAVAMGNAPDEVKAVAHHITLDIDHSGLAAAVKKFLLQGKVK
jgi:Cof subfamily protein (haloacid dehalogenase superfamily)